MSHNTQWYSNFFNGLIVESQRKMFNPEQTDREAEFIHKTLQLKPGAVIADIPCGDARISIALAKYGYNLRGVDISPEIVKGAPIEVHVGDMKKLPWISELDGVFCFGNSFAYFDDEGNRKFLSEVFRALKTGGKFILQSNLIAESILPDWPGRSWYEFGGILFLRNGSYDIQTGTMTSEYTLIKDGVREVKSAHYRIYLLREVLQMLSSIGFKNIKTFGSLAGKEFSLGDSSVYILAEK